MGRQATDLVLGLFGAMLGGGIGVLAFDWIAEQGFYALMLPGALAGLGGAAASRRESRIKGGLCGAVGLGATLYAEWASFPFLADGSFAYFLAHLHQLKPITMILGAVGTALAFYIGRGAFRPALSGS